MATLEKIRSKGVLLLVVIGVALLAFVVGDFLNNSSSFSHDAQTNVVVVGGEKVKIDEFQSDVNGLKQIYQMQMQTSQLNEGQEAEVRQSVFDGIVREKLLSAATDKVGISVSAKELFDLIGGNNIHPAIQSLPIFRDPQTGAFSRTALLQFVNSLNMSTQGLDNQQLDELNKYKSMWLYIENFVKNSKLQEKYSVLLNNTLNTNSIDAKYEFDNAKNTADVKYVVKPYSSIADSTITVSDSELKTAYKAKKDRFKQEAESREIKFISFPIKPSADDFAKIEDELKRQSAEFASQADVADLVNDNSDFAYPYYHVSEANVDADFKAFAFAGAKDAVSELQLFGDTYKTAKIIDKGVAPDSLKVRHILLYNADEAVTQKLSDSIVNAVRGGADFAALAKKYSINQGTAQNGGDLDWVREESLEKEMIKPAFYENKDLFSVKTNSGTQIVQVYERKKPVAKVQLAVLGRKVAASQNTHNAVYSEATSYIAKNNTLTKFELGAQEKGYVVRPLTLTENTPNINGIVNSRQVIRWAFEKDVNTISDAFTFDSEVLVAALVKINEKGYRPIEDVKDYLKSDIIRDKKADLISKQIAEDLKSNGSIESLARTLSLPIDTLTGVNFSGGRTAIGNEPAISATAPFLKTGELSAPLKGNNGIYVVSPYNITVSTTEYNEKVEKQTLDNQSRYSRNPQSIIDVLKEKEGVEDNRSRFY
ncbi:MAG: SurA N-terminal domain-containing protein [Prevotellaceae bacterium]|jgi:peptidyl-prolyl cis-trans isomerase D|nr:SurA N-terminal domain-containing protein [Prevotellaceae bacterium]